MLARELIARAKAEPLVWAGSSRSPVGGDEVLMDTLGMRTAFDYDQPTHVKVYYTTWGDYAGDDVQRSNQRSLLRDYPNVFVHVIGGWDSHYLALPIDADIDEDLFSTLDNITNDYPLYDEEDHSNLITELADEAWEAYLSYDVTSDLRKIHGERMEYVDEHKIRQRFYEITYEADEPPYAESAVGVVFPEYEATVRAIANEFGANPDVFELA